MSETTIPEQSSSQGTSIASLLLGILAIATSFVWYIGIVLGILAIIFGATSLKKQGRKKAITGIVTGIVGIIFSLLIILVMTAAVPSLQKNQRDTARKNDVSVLATNVTSFQTENRGQLPAASDLATTNLLRVTQVVSDGEPTPETAVYKTGTNCEDVSSATGYKITILLENGSTYCQGS